MFHKTFRIKSQSTIKGSLRKQLKREISLKYPVLSAQDLDSILPSKAAVSCVQYESGKDGSVSSYYVLDGNPILFYCGADLYPSVYTLWRCPHMVDSITTNAFVIKKLSEGADLMLPGVLTEERGGFSLNDICMGQPLAVNIVGNRCALAVGISLMSHDQMMANQMKGKVVQVLHIYKDHLWTAGTKQELPLIPYNIEIDRGVTKFPDEEESVLLNDDQDSLLMADLPVPPSTESGCVSEVMENSLESSDEIVKSKIEDEKGDSSDLPDNDKMDEKEASSAMPPAPQFEMDDLLLECFLKTIKSLVKPKDLPLLTSTLYGTYMIQACPVDLKLEIKKSSYKKVSKFLATMVDRGVIEMSSEGGTDVITSINLDHDLVCRFRPLLIKREQSKPRQAESSSSKEITVDEEWSPTQSLAPIFSSHGVSKSSRITSSEVRAIITHYVKDNELTNRENPQLVNVDPILSAALKVKVDVTSVLWKQLFSLVFQQMRVSYIVRQGSNKTIVRHSLPKVKLTVCRRANKTVTLVDNLDLYGISAADIAHRIQRTGACHSAVHATPGGAGLQVLIQGNQVKSTVKILEDVCGLPLKFIEAQDNIKPPKKKGHKN